MRLKAEQLDNTLQQALKPVYLVYGDEALLVEEAADKIRQVARQSGANDREVWHVEGHFDWSQIKWRDQNLSLFASQRLIEIRLPSGSPGKDGGEALRQLAAAPPADTTVLIISGKIAAAAQKSKWFTALDKLGVTVPLWPVDAAQLPGWISQRVQQRGLKIDRQLATLIAERVEGNLFAAAQEIDKLQLLVTDGQLDEKTILQSVADNARFEAFGLMDSVFLGQRDKVPRIIERLRAEGVDILAVFSAVSWSIHRAVDMAVQLQQGVQLDQAFASQKPPVWDKNKPTMRQALQRHDSMRWQQFLQQMAEIDQAAKGVVKSCPWRLLEKLCLQVAGS
ncbi:DNA polymerase III subunit delta [Methylophaga sp. OBS4]|uniref:DNA polymerase III subunit delta n=1 Tax=Methylophaga sp. OBS4 TaxID=2991935 RepID=UPI00224D15FF|nr:DNA polymerase III subunit delta [Methylophaga sp. OBS4]MCX4187593.1 DNA polymerase III subunit delta [Methylophaga sp. OBS4]